MISIPVRQHCVDSRVDIGLLLLLPLVVLPVVLLPVVVVAPSSGNGCPTIGGGGSCCSNSSNNNDGGGSSR